MKIRLWPDLVDWAIEASVNGEVLTLNGEKFDFSVIPEGYRLPGSVVGNKWFVESDYVERIDGELRLTIRLPVQWGSPEEVRNPAQPLVISITEGKVHFPDTTPPVAGTLPVLLEERVNV